MRFLVARLGQERMDVGGCSRVARSEAELTNRWSATAAEPLRSMAMEELDSSPTLGAQPPAAVAQLCVSS
jgi:hypothetical protein